MNQFTEQKHNDTLPCRSLAQPQIDHRFKNGLEKSFDLSLNKILSGLSSGFT